MKAKKKPPVNIAPGVDVVEDEEVPQSEEDLDAALEEMIPGFGELKAVQADLAAAAAKAASQKGGPGLTGDDRLLLNALGGMAGASVAGKLQSRYDKAVQDRVQRTIDELRAMQAPSAVPPAPAAPAAPSRGAIPAAGAAPGPVSAGPVSAGPTQLGTPGTYGRGVGPGQMTFNYGRAAGLPEIEAAKALGMGSQAGEVHDLLQRRREALQTIQQRFPSSQFVENPRFGGIMTPDQSVGRGPRASFVPETAPPGQPAPPPGSMRALPPSAPISTTPPPPGALQKAKEAAKITGGAAVDLLSKPRIVGAGAGVGAAEAAQQYYGRIEQDPFGAYLAAGTGALGSMAALPFIPWPARVALAGASPLTMYLYDKYKPYRSVLESSQKAPSDPQKTISEITGR